MHHNIAIISKPMHQNKEIMASKRIRAHEWSTIQTINVLD